MPFKNSPEKARRKPLEAEIIKRKNESQTRQKNENKNSINKKGTQTMKDG